MTKLELMTILKEAYESTFIDSILLISKHTKEYKKSEFYKETKISLLDLYKSYYQYMKAEYDLNEKINDLIQNIDNETIVVKVESLLKKLENNETVSNLLKNLLEKFNVEKILEESEEVQNAINKLK